MTGWLLGKYVEFQHRDEGQGTSEYAIIIGIVVVAAIALLIVFRGQLTQIWNNIQLAFSQVGG